jgi:hypothetical protein
VIEWFLVVCYGLFHELKILVEQEVDPGIRIGLGGWVSPAPIKFMSILMSILMFILLANLNWILLNYYIQLNAATAA